MQSTRWRIPGWVLPALSVLVLGCGPRDSFDREDMLEDTVEEVISPTHEELAGGAGELEASVVDFCEGDRTADQLATAREKWRALQVPLKQIRAWAFEKSPYRGNSFDVHLHRVDRGPADGDEIEAVIGDDQPIDVSRIESQDHRRNAKGFPAVEYLLFGSPGGGETAGLYRTGDRNADRRCDYLLAATRHARDRVDAYIRAWDPGGGDFVGDFGSRGSKGTNWLEVQDSIDAMVAQMAFVSDQTLSKRLLGGPLGQHETNDSVPNSVASPYAHHSLAQIEATFAGMVHLYRGADGESLADLVKFRDVAVHEDANERIEAAQSAIEEIPEPLSEAVEGDRETVESAQGQIDVLTTVIETDVKDTLRPPDP